MKFNQIFLNNNFLYLFFIIIINNFMNKIFKVLQKNPFLTKLLYKKISIDKMHKFSIEPYQIGERVDKYLKKTSIGWVLGQKCLRKKQIVIYKQDGSIINNSDYRIQQGDTLLVSKVLKDLFTSKKQLDQSRLVSKEQANRILQKMILFDNQNITIINKKPGYSVQGGLNPKSNLFSLMSSKYKKQLIHITHRLDKGTSGVVLFAKNKQIAQLVQTSMQEKGMISKFYLALTEGSELINKQGYIRCNIQWTGKNKARLCNQIERGSKDCITFYMPIQGWKVNSKKQKDMYRNLLGIKLLTGRKHQIRCHLSSYLQQPIINDLKYNGSSDLNVQFKNEEIEGNTQNQIKQENQEQMHLHAFGFKIYKKQLLQKIISNNRFVLNENLGGMHYDKQEKSLLFTTKIPSFWKLNKKEDIKLRQLSQIIQNSEKNMKKTMPNRRNITTIN